MLIKYYKHEDLAYANRKRFVNFNFEPFYQEEQKSVLLGDGASTSIKTNKNNICNYVKIDNTRWYVTSYVYLNGGQVELNLQRDVIGEFGLNDCYGKIERGYTDSVLKNKKELSLNQILKKRIPLVPSTYNYLNYNVDNHDNECWGICYFVKPSGLDPNTGNPYSDNININIPAFNPKVADIPVISNGSKFTSSRNANVYVEFVVKFILYNATGFQGEQFYRINVRFGYKNGWNGSINVSKTQRIDNYLCDFVINNPWSSYIFDDTVYSRSNEIANEILSFIFSDESSFVFPTVVDLSVLPVYNYNDATISIGDDFYTYSVETVVEKTYGSYEKDLFPNYLKSIYNDYITIKDADKIYIENGMYYNVDEYKMRKLTPEEAGILTIDLNTDFVDEPYSILVVPLFDVRIKGLDGSDFTVSKKKAFNVFNSVIEHLSGDSPYLIDAQIYPYCPQLSVVSSQIAGIPWFSVNSTNYTTNCVAQLFPKKDIKKEYIERVYSIVAPDQSSKFDFNYYDYKNEIVDGEENDVNFAECYFCIKTSLKPYSIITSCFPIPDEGAISGITYASDLRGCKASGSGFQASIASSAFETYKRQNSNFQQIFALQRQELSLTHEVERQNEKVSAITGTAAAIAMGSLAGAATMGGGKLGIVGAVSGGAAAGITTGTAYSKQYEQNEKLREFEVNLQQQSFDLQIGTIKNLPISVNRVSSFNEIILKNFYYTVEVYECTDFEKNVVDNFISRYGYQIGVFDFISNYQKNGWFLRSSLISSNFAPNLFNIAKNDLAGGIYIYD